MMAETITSQPARILEIELTHPLPELPTYDTQASHNYRRAICLVRLHTQPIGTVDLTLDRVGLTSAELAQQIWRTLGPEINSHLHQDGLPSLPQLPKNGLSPSGAPRCKQKRQATLATAPFASIIVATRDRTESLAICLASLLRLDYPKFEIIVVDNAPSSNATAEYIRHTHRGNTQIKYVREDRPGLAIAHNRGLAEIRGDVVAFTDDDVMVDQHWLAELVQGFDVGANVGCVTGMIFPAELQTPAQVWTEQFSGFNKGYARRIFDLAENRPASPLFPYAAGTFGSGANMSFKTIALRDIGGFDPALGAGTLAKGSDDLSAFFRIITAGYQLVYTPAAIVYHKHRRDYVGLQRHAYTYGVSLTAFLTATLLYRPDKLLSFIAKVPHGLCYALNPRSAKNARKPAGFPKELAALEFRGMLFGPLAYLQSRWRTRHTSQSARPYSVYATPPSQ